MLAQEEKHIKTLLLSNLMRLAGDPLPAKLEHGDPCKRHKDGIWNPLCDDCQKESCPYLTKLKKKLV